MLESSSSSHPFDYFEILIPVRVNKSLSLNYALRLLLLFFSLFLLPRRCRGVIFIFHDFLGRQRNTATTQSQQEAPQVSAMLPSIACTETTLLERHKAHMIMHAQKSQCDTHHCLFGDDCRGG